MMSSEDENFEAHGKSCFKVKPLPFRTNKYNKLIGLANKTVKGQFKVRIQGSPSKRPPPKRLKYEYIYNNVMNQGAGCI